MNSDRSDLIRLAAGGRPGTFPCFVTKSSKPWR